MADQPRTPLPYDEDELDTIADSIRSGSYTFNDFVGALRIELLNRATASRNELQAKLDEENERLERLKKDLGL